MNLSNVTGQNLGTGAFVVTIKIDGDYEMEKKFSTFINGKEVATGRDNKMALQFFAAVLEEYQPGLGSRATYYEEGGYHDDRVSIIMNREYY